MRLRPSKLDAVPSALDDDGRGADAAGGCGIRAEGGVGVAVSCPPKVRVDVDCALWIAI